MSKRQICRLATLFLMVTMSIFICCVLPDDPRDAENTKMNAVFMTTDNIVYEHSVVDTAGKALKIGAAIFLPENFDSVKLTIKSDSTVLADTVFKGYSINAISDTLWKTLVFTLPGIKTVRIIPYSRLNIAIVSANITIVESNKSKANHPPKWLADTLQYTLSDTSSFSTDLRTECTDADNDLLVFTLLGGCPGNDTILNGIYKFTATPNVTGTHLVRIVATDPYNASDTNFIKSIVTSTSNDTLLPQITLVTPSDTNAIATSSSYVIDVYCSDASGIASVIAEFNGNQYPGTPSNGHYTMMVNGLKQEVENSVVITVKDGSARHNESKKNIIFSFANSRTITYDGNGATSGTVPQDTGHYSNGATIIIKGNSGNLVKSGTIFAGWNTAASGSGIAYAAGSTFTIGTTDTILYAMWTTNSTYKVTYDGNGSNDGSVPVDEGNYETGATVSVKGNTGNLAKTGFSFSGWNTLVNGTGTSYAASATFKIISADVKLYAQWAVDSFTVSFNPQSGSAVAAQKIVYGGTAATPSPQPTRTGYTFGGWFKEASCTTLWNFALETVTADATIFAKWTVITCTVSFDTKGGGPIAGQTVNYGAFATSPTPAPTRTGYTFGGWFKEESYTTPWNFTSEAVTSNITIYAKWTVNTYSVVFNTQGGSNITSQTVNEGGTVTTPATNPTRNGYTFNGWYNEAACTSPWNFVLETITAPDTIYAGWTVNSYAVVFNSQGGSDVASQTINYGGRVIKPATSPTKTSYIFRGWFKEAAGTNAWNFVNDAIALNDTLYAKWAIMDADSNVYTEVTIGTQVWMVENLKTTKYNDGTPIPLASDSASWTFDWNTRKYLEAYCWYGNNSANKNPYGALYSEAVSNSGKITPIGWHVPSYYEWDLLITYLGGADVAGGAMKATGTTYWNSPNTGATNSSGFKALPGGVRNGIFSGINTMGGWWTTTGGEPISYIYCNVTNDSDEINETGAAQVNAGISIRCIRD